MTERLIHDIASNDGKLLLINDRYYCQLDSSCNAFTEWRKEPNSPSVSSYVSCYVLDICLEHGHHKNQHAKMYCYKHDDLLEKFNMSLMLEDDSALVNVVKAEVVDAPYPLDDLMQRIDNDLIPADYKPEDGDLMQSLDGTCNISFGEFNGKSANLEYYINGSLYFEIVDFFGVEDGEIVRVDDMSRRDVVVDMLHDGRTLRKDNVDDVAKAVNAKLRSLHLASSARRQS